MSKFEMVDLTVRKSREKERKVKEVHFNVSVFCLFDVGLFWSLVSFFSLSTFLFFYGLSRIQWTQFTIYKQEANERKSKIDERSPNNDSFAPSFYVNAPHLFSYRV